MILSINNLNNRMVNFAVESKPDVVNHLITNITCNYCGQTTSSFASCNICGVSVCTGCIANHRSMTHPPM